MDIKFKCGRWYQFSDFTRDAWKQGGLPIDNTCTVHPEAQICFPVHLSRNSIIHHGTRIDKYTYVNWDVVIFPNVHIGAYCSIARNVQLGLANHPTTWLSSNSFQYNAAHFPEIEEFQNVKRLKHLHHPKTIIGSDVWFGANAMVKSGVRIGHGAVIAAGAVVTKNVAPYSIVGGTPAKHIKYRFTQEQIDHLLESKWWLLPLKQIQALNFENIDECISVLKSINR